MDEGLPGGPVTRLHNPSAGARVGSLVGEPDPTCPN